MKRLRKFVTELFRRKVVRLLGAYVALLWLLAEGFASVFPVIGIPIVVIRVFLGVGIGALPLLAFLSWKYDILPPQLVRDAKDVAADNPALGRARVRHEAKNAGYVLLSWSAPDGTASQKRFFQPVAIGREPNNDIELADQRVSRHHAVLWAENGTWHVRDLDSANGTFVGHTRVAGTAALPQTCDLRFHVNGPTVSVHVARTPETLVS